VAPIASAVRAEATAPRARHEQELPDHGIDGELLAQLSYEARRRRLARLALAAGKLPSPFQVCALQPSRQEKRVITFDHRRGDDDSHCRRFVTFAIAFVPFVVVRSPHGYDRHVRRSGHAAHFGLRAVHTVAPKSISA
jgi:hypothetical protein